MGVETKANTLLDGGAPERGHSASLEPIAQLGDALGSVGTVSSAPYVVYAYVVDAAELGVAQAAKERRRVNGR